MTRDLPPGAATVARLDVASAWRRFSARPEGPGWVRLSDRLADAAAMDGWVRAERDGFAAGHPDLAGALVVYRFAGSLAELVVGPLVDQDRVLVLGPADVWFRLGPAARLDGLAVADATVTVLPGDDDAGAPGTTTAADRDALRSVAVDSLVAVFEPLARAVRERAPFGLAGMWGTLADHTAEVAMSRARGRAPLAEQRAAWVAADALVTDLAGRQPLVRGRPSLTEVSGAAGDGCFVTKGTCCLVYKVTDMCSSCPLRSEADRRARFVAHLARDGAR
jgi:hypothetical protein